MNIDSIQNGYVIDHIHAGRSMEIYHYLGLDALDCSVAIIKNAKSQRMGKKDIIKIDQEIPLDLDLLGYIDPGISVNIIREGKLVEKKKPEMPARVVNVMKCKNPRVLLRPNRNWTRFLCWPIERSRSIAASIARRRIRASDTNRGGRLWRLSASSC